MSDENYSIANAKTNGEWRHVAKRGLDLTVSFVLLLLLLPAWVAVAIAIKTSSRGSIFFVQERVGLNQRRFRIYKFRTMVSDAELRLSELKIQNETGGSAFKMKNDPRITRVGKFLRRGSIDELPQLLNVLAGDMSLVGPRPLTMSDYEDFGDAQFYRRFSVKPGITCLYQVSGRSLLTFDQWMRLDLRYIDEWSLWLDCKILWWTIPAVLKGVGAV